MRWHSVSRGKGGRRNRIGKVSQSITSACDSRLRGCNVIETHEHAQRLQRVVKVCSTGIKPSPLSFYCIHVVGSIVSASTFGKLLRVPFDANAGPNEAHLSSGDSGGA